MGKKTYFDNDYKPDNSQYEQEPTKTKGPQPVTLGDLYKPNKLGNVDATQTEVWYNAIPPDPKEFPSCSNEIINQLKEEAKTMLDSETNGYNIRTNKNSEKKWMRSVMSKGTGRDKVAAFTLMVQDNPLYNLSALRSIINLIRPGKKESILAIDTLVELFTTDLLPPNQKLRWFSQRPLSMLDELSSGNPAGRRRRLVHWYFEDLLKTMYNEFLQSLKSLAGEAVDANKEKAIKAMAFLLESHPEQEAVLLTYLINKLGDPSKQVAAKALTGLTQVLRKHPNMKGVIVNEIEKLLFRPNIGAKARYYSMCFLSQLTYNRSDTQLAAGVIKIYFSFFKACVKKGDADSKMLSILLNGVNRAYPYAKQAMDSLNEQVDTLYKLVHIAPLHIGLQALVLLFQVADHKSNVSDRFYQVLYRKLLDPALGVTSHAPMFLNLTYQALKKDENIPRLRVFIKRLLQICCYFPVPMTCATLYMVSQVQNRRLELAAHSFETCVDKQVDGDVSNPGSGIEAFLEDDSEDEHYEDVDESVPTKSKDEKTSDDVKPSWVHVPVEKKVKRKDGFDPMERNPLYARGEFCIHAELLYLSKHFHPTIALFASNILENQLINYTGDPLKDFTLIRFVERFSFKNPKKQSEMKSSSLFAKRQMYAVSGVKSKPISAYAHQPEKKIPVDEMYLFKYLQQRRMLAEEQKKSKEEEDEDVESVASDEFEDMIGDLMAKRGFKTDYDDDDIDEDIDFADEYSKNMTAKKSQKKKVVEEEDDDDDDMGGSDGEDDDLSGGDDLDEDDKDGEDLDGDEDIDFDDLDDLGDDAEDLDFGSESEDEDEDSGPAKGKKKKKSKAYDDSDLYANAEEFSELLDAASSARDGTLGALSNTDNASLKQLNWESDRDRWAKGYKGKGKNFKNSNFKKGPKFGGGKKPGKPLGVKKPSFKAKAL